MSSRRATGKPLSTRDHLLAAGRKVLESGRSFSMGAVARKARVSRQAVYLHFADRFALLEAIVAVAREESAITVDRERVRDADDAVTALEAYLRAMLRLTQSHGKLDQAVRDTLASDPQLAARWARRNGRSAVVASLVARLSREGLLQPGLSDELAVALVEALTGPAVIAALLTSAAADAVSVTMLRALTGALFGDQLKRRPAHRAPPRRRSAQRATGLAKPRHVLHR